MKYFNLSLKQVNEIFDIVVSNRQISHCEEVRKFLSKSMFDFDEDGLDTMVLEEFK